MCEGADFIPSPRLSISRAPPCMPNMPRRHLTVAACTPVMVKLGMPCAVHTGAAAQRETRVRQAGGGCAGVRHHRHTGGVGGQGHSRACRHSKFRRASHHSPLALLLSAWRLMPAPLVRPHWHPGAHDWDQSGGEGGAHPGGVNTRGRLARSSNSSRPGSCRWGGRRGGGPAGCAGRAARPHCGRAGQQGGC